LRTIKIGTGLSRSEFEEPIPEHVFLSLWPMTQGSRVHKRRYRVPAGDLTWEIDEFLDRDLVLAEIEVPSEDTEVVLPDWLLVALVREVTEEQEFSNVQLAK
jgi:CYTH domain-containing protein